MLVLLTVGLMAQKNKSLPTIRICATDDIHQQKMNTDSEYAQSYNELESLVNKFVSENPNGLSSKAVVTIPVVFHVVLTSAQFTSFPDSRITEQMTVLNRDYAGLNTHSMGAFSSTLKSNTELQFCLAAVNPTGGATNGIEKKILATSQTWGTSSTIKHTSQGGLDSWDANRYLNIWVCNLGGGLCGYALYPTAPLSNEYGLVCHYQYVGVTGASAPFNLGGTTTHEIGHCFNLKHIWADAAGCSPDDLISDTPPQDQENYGTPSSPLYDACSTTSPGVMFMNFMDYVDDVAYTNFTPGQKTRIQACFQAGGPLYNLSLSNACTGGSTAPVAAFTGTPTAVNVGGTVTYSSQSTGTIASYSWSFPGGTPATSTSAGPVTVTYNTAGVYNATLTVGTPTNTLTKTSYITVTSCGTSGYNLNFECNADFDITFSPWTVNDVDLGLTYGIEDASANSYVFNHSGEAMAYLAFNPASTVPTLSTDAELQPHAGLRFGACMNALTASAPNNDWLISPKVQLGTGSTFTMWVKTYTNQWGLERYKVGVSTTNNSPASFTIISTGGASGYEEAPITWTQKTYSLSSYNNQQVHIGINCVSNDAFIFMVDDININTTLTGLSVVPEVQMINLFPNPASESAYVDITSIGNKEVSIEVYDMFGKQQKVVVSNEATNLRKIDLKGLSTGVYITKIITSLGEKIEKLIVY